MTMRSMLVMSIVIMAGQPAHAQVPKGELPPPSEELQIGELRPNTEEWNQKNIARVSKYIEGLRNRLKNQEAETKKTQAELSHASDLLRQMKEQPTIVPDPQLKSHITFTVQPVVGRDQRPITRPDDRTGIQVPGHTPSEKVKNADELIRALDEARSRLVKEQDKARAELEEKTKP